MKLSKRDFYYRKDIYFSIHNKYTVFANFSCFSSNSVNLLV